MRKYLFPLLFLPLLFAACKKKSNTYTVMTLYVSGDSTWSTTNVTAITQIDGSVVITGTYNPTYETISLTLAGYREGRKTYYIGSGTIAGYSYGSSAAYNYSTSIVNATDGQIAITNYTVHTMDGTFDFHDNKVHVSGTFKAPIP